MISKTSENLSVSPVFFPIFASLIFLLSDFRGILVNTSGMNYAPLALILFYFFIQKAIIFRFNSITYMTIVITLSLYGLGFAILGKLYSDNPGSYLALFLPIIMLFFSFDFNFTENLKNIAKGLSIAIIALQILTILTLNSILPFNSILNFSFEKVYLFALGISLSYLYKMKYLFILNILLYFWNFALYPAASYFLPIIAIGIFSTIILIREWKGLFLWIQIIFLSTILGGINLLLNGQALLTTLFSFTGKQDNSIFRAYLMQRSLEKIRESPLVGSLFKGDMTKAKIGEASIVSHNDYINMLLGGGILLIFIFSAFVAYILATSARQIKQLKAENNDPRMLIALNISLITFLLVSNFLALLSKPSNSIFFFSLVFAITLLAGKKSLR